MSDRSRPQIYWGDGSGRDTYCLDGFGGQKPVFDGGETRAFPNGHVVPAFALGLREMPNPLLSGYRQRGQSARGRSSTSPSYGKKLTNNEQSDLGRRLSQPKFERISGKAATTKPVGRPASCRANYLTKSQPINPLDRSVDVAHHTRLKNTTVRVDQQSSKAGAPLAGRTMNGTHPGPLYPRYVGSNFVTTSYNTQDRSWL